RWRALTRERFPEPVTMPLHSTGQERPSERVLNGQLPPTNGPGSPNTSKSKFHPSTASNPAAMAKVKFLRSGFFRLLPDPAAQVLISSAPSLPVEREFPGFGFFW